MSKITFRADDDLVESVESLDVSKSEVMREALRAYLADRGEVPVAERLDDSIDALIADRVDEALAERLDGRSRRGAPGVDVTISVDPEVADGVRVRKTTDDAPASAREGACERCGESLSDDHVFCPNCGEKASHRSFCECGTELKPDWAHCPDCGRRTPTADVL